MVDRQDIILSLMILTILVATLLTLFVIFSIIYPYDKGYVYEMDGHDCDNIEICESKCEFSHLDHDCRSFHLIKLESSDIKFLCSLENCRA